MIGLFCLQCFLLLDTVLLPGAGAQDGATVAPTGITTVDATNSSLVPQSENLTISATNFRQKVFVGNGKPIEDDKVPFFQQLYGGYAKDNIPPEDRDFVTTTCTVNYLGLIFPETNQTSRRHRRHHRRFLRRKRGLQEETGEPIEAMDIDFTMSYESEQINVTLKDYASDFQTWLNENLDQVTIDLQTVLLNVTSVNNASRITTSSTDEQTAAPTMNATATNPPIESINDTTNDVTDGPETMAPTTAAAPSSSNGLAIILSSMIIGACIVIAGLLVYWRRHRVGEDKFPRSSSKESHQQKRPTEEMSESDIDQAKESAPNGNDDDKKVRIKEPSSSRSSSKGSSIDEENPTKGEHYDDHFHYYFKKKNERRERREMRRLEKERLEQEGEDPSKRRSSSKTRTSSNTRSSSKTTRSSSKTTRSSRRTSRDVSPPAPGESADAIKARLKRLDELKDANVIRPREYEERRSQILAALLQ